MMHPHGPLAAMADVQAVTSLVMDIGGIGSDIADRPVALAAAWEQAGSAGLLADWEHAADFARRDVVTTFAELAARTGVPADAVELHPDDETPGLPRLARVAARHGTELLGLAAAELATPGRDAGRSLLPEAPWHQPFGPTGIYAIGIVCDSTEPPRVALTACLLLAALAYRRQGAAG